MSTASKCDRCGNLFERKVGDICLDLNIAIPAESKGGDELWDESYEGFDLCSGCTAEFRAFAKLEEWLKSDG